MKKTGFHDHENRDPVVREAPVGGRKVLLEILDWVKTIAIGVVIGILIVVFVVQRDNVYGDSMLSTLHSGDVVFTEKISTYFHNYHRGDIVVLDGQGMVGYNKTEYLVKRIVGLPGETIRITDGSVYVREAGSSEFVLLDEPYLDPGITTTVRAWEVESAFEITLADNEYYCLGDNRPVSNDSRTLGPFTVDRIKGIAFVLVYPFSNFGFL